MSSFGLHGIFGAQKVFGQVWGKSGKIPSHPQKFVCSYTYIFVPSEHHSQVKTKQIAKEKSFMIFSSIKSHKKFLSQIPLSLHYSFTRDPPHSRMIRKMFIASNFCDKFIKLTTFLGLFSIAFTILMTSAVVGNFLFHFLASCPPMLHDTLDTRNI